MTNFVTSRDAAPYSNLFVNETENWIQIICKSSRQWDELHYIYKESQRVYSYEWMSAFFASRLIIHLVQVQGV